MTTRTTTTPLLQIEDRRILETMRTKGKQRNKQAHLCCRFPGIISVAMGRSRQGSPTMPIRWHKSSQALVVICAVLVFVACQELVSSAFLIGPTLPLPLQKTKTLLYRCSRPSRARDDAINSKPVSLVLRANNNVASESSSNTTSLLSETNKPPRNSNNSRRAREMLHFLQVRFEPDATNGVTKANWTKTQMYLYRANERLTWEQLEGVARFLHSLFPPSTARTILQTAPRILRKPVETFLQPTADFLLDLWGPSLFQEAINRNPRLLLSSGVGYTQHQEEADDEIAKLLSATAGLSSKAVQELKRSAPFVFGISAQKVEYVLNYLLEILSATDEKSGTTVITSKHQKTLVRKTLARIIATHPHLLNLSVEANLRPRVEFLQSTCDMNATQISKMVYSSTGTVLSLSVDEKLKPTLDLLKTMLSVIDEKENSSALSSKERLRKCLLSHPQVLTLSMSNLQSKVHYFSEIEAKEGYSSRTSLASRILSRCPAVYSLSLTDNIIPKVAILSKVWGVSTAYSKETGAVPTGTGSSSNNNDVTVSLSHWLQEFPNILTMSLEGNIRPTLNFFNRTRYTRLTEDWELVPGATRIPGRYMAASLYNRLLPRWHFCLSKGVMVMDSTVATKTNSEEEEQDLSDPASPPVANAPPLHVLVQASDAVFCEKLGLDGDEYAAFRESAIPRLKFSSQFDTWLKTGRPIQV